MAAYETRQIKGWRSRMEDEAEVLRRRVWEAPATTVYHEGLSAPLGGDPAGCVRWFHREFGEERAIARAHLKAHQAERGRIAYRERSQDQRDAANAQIRASRAAKPDEWRRAEAEKKRQRRAAKPELYRAIDRRYAERHRVERNARKREAYARDPETARIKDRAWKAAKRERDRIAAKLDTAAQTAQTMPGAV
ncbi:MAG: hypothetical protein HYY98_15490 [Burkholderiales bacterium]|nr:hypothetical protein [Burkholderiales bacterium]